MRKMGKNANAAIIILWVGPLWIINGSKKKSISGNIEINQTKGTLIFSLVNLLTANAEKYPRAKCPRSHI